jgi:hypothetical protein
MRRKEGLNNMTKAIPSRELRTEDNLHYVKFGSEESFILANKGLTDWTQAMNPNVDDGVQYIGEKNAESNLMGYAPNVSYGGTAYPSDKFAAWLYSVGKEEKVGEKFTEVEVETWNEMEKSGEFKAYQRIYEVQPDNPGSGEGGGKLALEGTFAQKGSVTIGKFNISTKTFTADGE